MSSNLYITDVDFTLLRSDRTLSDFSKRGIEKLHQENIPFTMATARSVYSLYELIGEIRFELPLIEFNGGYITNYESKKPYHIFDLKRTIVDEIITTSRNFELSPIISTFSDKQNVYPPIQASEGILFYINDRRSNKDPRLRNRIEYNNIEDKHILALTYIGEKEVIEPLYRKLNNNLANDIIMHFYENKYTPQKYWLTIHSLQSTKENSIRKLQGEFGLRDHHLVVFGDDVNDIGMLKIADQAIAVENAKPAVKAEADHIIGSNDTDAVIKYILEQEQIEIKL